MCLIISNLKMQKKCKKVVSIAFFVLSRSPVFVSERCSKKCILAFMLQLPLREAVVVYGLDIGVYWVFVDQDGTVPIVVSVQLGLESCARVKPMDLLTGIGTGCVHREMSDGLQFSPHSLQLRAGSNFPCADF